MRRLVTFVCCVSTLGGGCNAAAPNNGVGTLAGAWDCKIEQSDEDANYSILYYRKVIAPDGTYTSTRGVVYDVEDESAKVGFKFQTKNGRLTRSSDRICYLDSDYEVEAYNIDDDYYSEDELANFSEYMLREKNKIDELGADSQRDENGLECSETIVELDETKMRTRQNWGDDDRWDADIFCEKVKIDDLS